MSCLISIALAIVGGVSPVPDTNDIGSVDERPAIARVVPPVDPRVPEDPEDSEDGHGSADDRIRS